MSKGKEPVETAPVVAAPAAVEAGLPEGKAPVAAASSEPSPVYDKGIYVKDDGEEYALGIIEGAEAGRTHFAKNTVHFWNGTEEEFRAQFTKK